MSNNNLVEKIRENTDIVTIIGESVGLRKKV